MESANLRVENIRKLIRRNAKGPIYKLLNRLHPADIAYLITSLNELERRRLWSFLHDRTRIAEIILELNDNDIVDMLSHMEPKLASEVLTEMESDDVSYVLRLLPEELKEKILQYISGSELSEVEELLHYPENSAGAMMNTEYIAMLETTTVKEATKLIHRSEHIEMVYYLYVVDSEDRLVGVISLRQLITNQPEKLLSEIMAKDVIFVLDSDDREHVAKLVDKYDFLALPILNEQRKMVGIITFDDVIDVIRDEATEDFYRMTGTSQDSFSYTDSSVKNAKARLPWLAITLIGEMLSGVVIAGFQGKVTDFLILASFMPVIMAMGGNVGTQSATIIVRNIALGKLDYQKVMPILFKELKVGLLMGAAMAIPVYFIAPIVHAAPHIGAIVGVALFFAMGFAALSGTFVPLMLIRFGVDPAVASGPFISTFNDITGLSIYFSIAILLLSVLG